MVMRELAEVVNGIIYSMFVLPQTVCVEKNDTLGGTCLNVGCIPSKVKTAPDGCVALFMCGA